MKARYAHTVIHIHIYMYVCMIDSSIFALTFLLMN